MLVGRGPLTALASEAGKFGAATVYVAADDSLDPPLPQPRVDVLPDLGWRGIAPFSPGGFLGGGGS